MRGLCNWAGDPVCHMLGSQQLFPERIGTDILRDVVAWRPAGTEKDIDRFNLIGVEDLTANRDPQVILTYERLRNIFLKTQAIHQGTY